LSEPASRYSCTGDGGPLRQGVEAQGAREEGKGQGASQEGEEVMVTEEQDYSSNCTITNT